MPVKMAWFSGLYIYLNPDGGASVHPVESSIWARLSVRPRPSVTPRADGP